MTAPPQATLKRLIQAGSDLTLPMRAIGEHLLNTTRQRFRAEESPDCKPWAPLSDTTLARKKQNRDKILTESGHLGGSINYRATKDFVEIGSPRVYAGTHQFGAKKGPVRKNRQHPHPLGRYPRQTLARRLRR